MLTYSPLEVGFRETSAFSAAFRHTTGTTSSEYCRTLAGSRALAGTEA
jgi:AraC-like DNA-binding protein